MANQEIISIIIPHYNGISILKDCLISIQKNTFHGYEVIVVDNGSTDGSQQTIKREFEWVRLLQSDSNLGYAGGCNLGMKYARGKFFLLLNNDTCLTENTLEALVDKMKENTRLGLVQPKIRAIQNKLLFDYSGGAGGEIDIFGYPFTRGRLFDKIERDSGQFDAFQDQIFWASGTCCMIRREVVEKIGALDELFFAHMEEIDLNWRAHLAGFLSAVAVNAVIYHYSGYTLKPDNQKKMYLNHRNNLIMLIKNYSLITLLWVLPVRTCLELVNFLYAVITGNLKWAGAIARSIVFLIFHANILIHKHMATQKLRMVKDCRIRKYMYNCSIVWAYFIGRNNSVKLLIKMQKK